MTTAIILAGGMGTRLKSVVADRPKPLALIAGRPFLEWQLELLAAKGVGTCILAVGYLADQIQTHFGSEYRGMVIQYSVEASPLGTGGAFRQALDHVETDSVIVMNGDTFLDYPLQELLAAVKHGADASIAVVTATDSSRYGTVLVDSAFSVTGFEEKGAMVRSQWINAGAYCINKSAFLKEGLTGAFSLESHYFQAKVKALNLKAIPVHSRFIDIGIPSDFMDAQTVIPDLAQQTSVNG